MPKNRGRARQSHFINRKTTQSIFRAFDYAIHSGQPFNWFVTIILPDTSRQGAATAFEKIRHKFRDWLNYKCHSLELHHKPNYAYVFENDIRVGPHVHWVVHVPEELKSEFLMKLPRWTRKVIGELREFDLDVECINQQFAKHLAKYLVKGTDPAFVNHFHLSNVSSPQGIFTGKRAGVSISFGKTARSQANFRPRRSRMPDSIELRTN